VLALDRSGSVAEARAQNLEVLAHGVDRTVEPQSPHRLDRHLVADPDPEDEAAARKLIESGSHLHHRGGVPRVDGQHTGPKTHPLGRARVSSEDKRGVARIRKLRSPDRLEPEPFRGLRPSDRLVEGLHRGIEGSEASHSFSNIFRVSMESVPGILP
jgi:hypothetical protein